MRKFQSFFFSLFRSKTVELLKLRERQILERNWAILNLVFLQKKLGFVLALCIYKSIFVLDMSRILQKLGNFKTDQNFPLLTSPNEEFVAHKVSGEKEDNTYCDFATG